MADSELSIPSWLYLLGEQVVTLEVVLRGLPPQIITFSNFWCLNFLSMGSSSSFPIEIQPEGKTWERNIWTCVYTRYKWLDQTYSWEQKEVKTKAQGQKGTKVLRERTIEHGSKGNRRWKGSWRCRVIMVAANMYWVLMKC